MRQLIGERLEARRVLASYVVDTAADVVAEDGMISLREALQAANTNAVVNLDTIAGDEGTQDAITFAEGLSTITLGSQLSISDDVSISLGSATSQTISGGNSTRIFSIDTGTTAGSLDGEANISGLTLTEGAADRGGAIFVSSGQVVGLFGMTIESNNATGDTMADGGGAIFNDGGSIVLSTSTIASNGALGTGARGGGIFNTNGGVFDISNSTITDNATTGLGGGIHSEDGSLGISNSTVFANAANVAGGGVSVNGGAVRLNNATIASNTVESPIGNGGGLASNSGVELRSVNSVIAGNTRQGVTPNDVIGEFTAVSNTLIGDTSRVSGFDSILGSLSSSGNIGDIDPELGPLQDNGGSTLTALPQPSSPLINAGDNASASGFDFDQRLDGFPRIVGTLIDIGAVEVQNPTNTIVVTTTSDTIDAGDGLISLREAIIQSNSTTELEIIDVPAGIYPLTIVGAGEDSAATGDLDITADVIIGVSTGSSSDLTGDDLGDRIFEVFSGVNVTINSGVRISGGVAAGDGGGIANRGGNVVLNGVDINGNRAVGDGAMIPGSGGGIFNGPGGTVVVGENSSIRNNVANRAGGGIEDASGSGLGLTIADTTFSENNAGTGGATAAPGNGGGIHISGGGDVQISGSTFTENVAAREGGALWNDTGLMTIDGDSSTIQRNSAAGDAADDGGGGIFNNGGRVVLSGTFIDENFATGTSGSGGGILNLGGVVEITNTTISDNNAIRAGGGIETTAGSTLTMSNGQIIRNDAGTGPGNGGGIHISGDGSASLSDVFVAQNTAVEGGGLWNSSTGTLSITGGRIIRNDASGDAADQGGGAIYNDGGVVTVTDAELSENIALGTSGSGGGILTSGGNVTLTNSVVAINTANRAGGGIETTGGATLTISGGQFTGNGAGADAMDLGIVDLAANPGNGGGIHLSGADNVTVSGVSFTGNEALNEGGGLWNSGTGSIIVRDSTISGNAGGDGGGIFQTTGTGSLQVINTTIFDNSASDAATPEGGGIAIRGGSVTLRSVTITQNAATGGGGGIFNDGGTLTAFNTVVAANTDSDVTGAFDAASNTFLGLADGATGISGTDGNTVGGDAMLATELVNNGGATSTVLPLSGSPLIDAGDNANLDVQDFDQRGDGFARVSGSTVDIGALEIQSTMNVPITVTSLSDTVDAGDGVTSLREAILMANATAGPDIIVLTNSTYTLDSVGAGEDAAATGDLDITEALTITGPDAASTIIDASMLNDRAFEILTDVSLTISGVTVSGGTAAANGGAFMNRGSLTISESIVDGNTAAGDASSIPGSGGAIFNSAGALLVISDSTLSNNTANRAGGAIEDASDVAGVVGVRLTNVVMSGNNAGVAPATAAPGNGGALHVTGAGDVVITGGAINANTAASEGGGLWNGIGTMTVTDTTFLNNIASGTENDNGGGALFNNGGTLNITDATITDNDANGPRGGGGGVMNVASGTLNISGTTISGNTADGTEMGDGGAGVLNINGTVTITGGSITANAATGTSGSGGAILSRAGSLTITDTTISGNTANRAGGGIELGRVTASLTNVTLGGDDAADGNSVAGSTANPGNGGGLHTTFESVVTITGGSIRNNAAVEGGGVWNAGIGTMTMTDTLIEDNSAIRGGGVYQQGTGDSVPVQITVTNVAPDGGPTNSGLYLTPVFNAFHDGAYDLFDTSPASAGLESLAEDGAVDTISGEFSVAQSTGVTAVLANGGPIAPGRSVTGVVTLDPVANRYHSYASMVIPSNDAFIGNDDPLMFPLFDVDGNFAGSIDRTVPGSAVLDAGTETNDETDAAFFDQTAPNTGETEGSTVQSHPGFIGSVGNPTGTSIILGGTQTVASMRTFGVSNADFTAEGYDLLRFQIDQLASGLTLDGVTIRNNTATGDDATDGGGGIYNDGSTVTIDGGSVSGNVANGASGSGGGIFNAGDVTATGTTISGNTANRAGGGIEAIGGSTTTISGSTLSSNVAGPSGSAAPGNGGAIHITADGNVSLTDATVDGNAAANEGGGLWNSAAGTLTVTTSTISANSTVDGGGIFNDGTGGDITVTNSTIAGNTASGLGGGIATEGASLTLTSVTIALNTADTGGGVSSTAATAADGSVTATSSIIASNTATTNPDISGTGTSGGNNLVGDSTGAVFTTPVASDIFDTDPLLATLTDNGGPTQTIALLSGSPALNAGAAAGLTVDQRGTDRPQGDGIDIGAFESDLTSVAVDPATLIISATDADKAEGNSGTTEFTFTVTRGGNTGLSSTVTYAVTDTGTATADDFDEGRTPTGTVSFAAGETTMPIVINVVGDMDVEADETFSVLLSNPSDNTTVTTDSANGTIRNDDTDVVATTLAIATTDSSIGDEGDSGTTPFAFTVTRGGDTTGATTVDYTVSGTGDAADFGGTLPSGTVTFAAGETTMPITINVAGDNTVEPDEDFTVTLSGPSGSETITTDAAAGTILNDDTEATGTTLAIATTDSSISNEGDSGTTPFTFTVTRGGDTTGSTTVDYTVAGTADAADFGGTLPTGTVTFAAGETTMPITIDVTGDTTVEPDEDFTVMLSGPSGSETITTDAATGTIRNDDTAPTGTSLAVTATSTSDQDEGDSGTRTYRFTVTRSGDTTGITTADYTVTAADGSTVSAADFGGTFPSGMVSFAAGDSTATIALSVSGETTPESDERFTLTLSNASDGATITTDSADGVIRDDDQVPGDTNIIVPERVVRPYPIPANNVPTAIIFAGVQETTVSVVAIGTVSVTETIRILDGDLQPIHQRNSNGVTFADIQPGEFYAILFDSEANERLYVVRSSSGPAALSHAPTTNIIRPTDVTGEGETTPLDALRVINHLDRQSIAEGEAIASATTFMDVNRDDRVSAQDALIIINKLSREGGRTAQTTATQLPVAATIAPAMPDGANADEVFVDAVMINSSPSLLLDNVEADAALTESQTIPADAVDQVIADDEESVHESAVEDAIQMLV